MCVRDNEGKRGRGRRGEGKRGRKGGREREIETEIIIDFLLYNQYMLHNGNYSWGNLHWEVHLRK